MEALALVLCSALASVQAFVQPRLCCATARNEWQWRSSAREGPETGSRVFVDLDVLADSLEFEGLMTLRGLQQLTLRGPWHEVSSLPSHRSRTFDLREKFDRIMSELRVSQPAEAVMILRMLFEEDEVGARALRAREEPSGQRWEGGGWAPTSGPLTGVRPGTRPLTAGEVIENWESVLRARCASNWIKERVTTDEMDRVVAQLHESQLNTDALRWRPEAVRLLRSAVSGGRVRDVVVLVRADGPMVAGLKNMGDLDQVLGFPTSLRPLATAFDLADEIRRDAALDTMYLGGSPGLTLQVAAAIRPDDLQNRVRLYYCSWIHRWDGRRASIPNNNDLGIRVLDSEFHNLRYILGLHPPR